MLAGHTEGLRLQFLTPVLPIPKCSRMHSRFDERTPRRGFATPGTSGQETDHFVRRKYSTDLQWQAESRYLQTWSLVATELTTLPGNQQIFENRATKGF